MAASFDKRALLKGGMGVAGFTALAPGVLRAQNAKPVTWALVKPGFTTLVIDYIRAKALDKKNGVTMAPPVEYTAVSTYYNDFSAGNFDIAIGSWDVFAARYQAGVPIQLLCMITNADMIFILTGDKAVTKIEDLRGKTLAAAQSTGTYRMVSALVKESHGLEFGKDVTIQGVDNPAAAVTLVMANRAEGGLSWEPNISAALNKKPDLRTIFNAGQSYREQTKLDLPYFGVAVTRDWAKRNPDLIKGLRQTFADCIAGINANPQEAVTAAGANSGFLPEVMTDAIKSHRLNFNYSSMASDGDRNVVTKAGAFMTRNGLLTKPLDDGFFLTA